MIIHLAPLALDDTLPCDITLADPDDTNECPHDAPYATFMLIDDDTPITLCLPCSIDNYTRLALDPIFRRDHLDIA